VNGNSRDTVASMLQSRDRLKNRRSKNDKVSKGMWKAVEASSGEVGMGKTKGGKSERKGKEEEVEKRKDSGSEENSREVGNMG